MSYNADDMRAVIRERDRLLKREQESANTIATLRAERDEAREQRAMWVKAARTLGDKADAAEAREGKLRAAMSGLSFVITWLENGCEVAGAVNELRIYQSRINAALEDKP